MHHASPNQETDFESAQLSFSSTYHNHLLARRRGDSRRRVPLALNVAPSCSRHRLCGPPSLSMTASPSLLSKSAASYSSMTAHPQAKLPSSTVLPPILSASSTLTVSSLPRSARTGIVASTSKTPASSKSGMRSRGRETSLRARTGRNWTASSALTAFSPRCKGGRYRTEDDREGAQGVGIMIESSHLFFHTSSSPHFTMHHAQQFFVVM